MKLSVGTKMVERIMAFLRALGAVIIIVGLTWLVLLAIVLALPLLGELATIGRST